MGAKKEKSAAVITIFDPADLSTKGRKDIARWMREQATFLEKYNKEMASRYRARYIYS